MLYRLFLSLSKYVKDEANIPLEIINNNEHEDGGINFYISYVGPLGGEGKNKRVKVDISRSEMLEFEPVMQDVFVGYSDIERHQLLCYHSSFAKKKSEFEIKFSKNAKNHYLCKKLHQNLCFLSEIASNSISKIINQKRVIYFEKTVLLNKIHQILSVANTIVLASSF